MKKLRNIGLAIGLVVLLSTAAKAQYFYTSFGYANTWNIPTYIEYSIHDNYYGYEVAHVKRQKYHGQYRFNVLLHRNGRFVEVRYDRFGNIYKTVRYNNYPLMAHNCTYHCGYHRNYYQTYYPRYHHTKVVYVNSYPQGNKHHQHQNNYYTNVYVDNDHNGHNKSNYSSQGQQSSSRQKQPAVSTQTQRKSNVIRQPQQAQRNTTYNNTRTSSTQTVRQSAPRNTSNARTAEQSASARTTANRSGRGNSR